MLHVSNLTRNVKAGHLEEIFGEFGALAKVELAVDQTVNLPKGFAFVTFKQREDAEKAQLYLDGGQLDGNFLKVAFVLVNRRRQDSPSRNGGGRDMGLPRGSFGHYGGGGGGAIRGRSRSPPGGFRNNRGVGDWRGMADGRGGGMGGGPRGGYAAHAISPPRRRPSPLRRGAGGRRSRSRSPPPRRGRSRSPPRRRGSRSRSPSGSRSRSRSRGRKRRTRDRSSSGSRSRSRSRSSSGSRSGSGSRSRSGGGSGSRSRSRSGSGSQSGSKSGSRSRSRSRSRNGSPGRKATKGDVSPARLVLPLL
ncbi:unnamed protein product [Phaeothamnion confervicola]